MKFTLLFSFLLCFCFNVGLSQEIDNLIINEEFPIKLEKHTQHLLFKYQPTVYLTQDNERCTPMGFVVKLPLNLKTWEMYNSSYFEFYLKSKQFIMINTPVFNDQIVADTIYTPSLQEILQLMEYSVSSNSSARRKTSRSLERMKQKSSRKNVVITRNGATILLFNIKENHFDEYVELIKSFNPI